MGSSFEALNGDAQIAVEWKARQNLSQAMGEGNQMAINNQKKFIETNKESLANNSESVRRILMEYKNLPKMDD